MSPTAPAPIRPATGLDAPGLVAGVTTRHFAPAQTPVADIRARLGASLGLPVASVGQVHEARVAVVTGPGHVSAHDGLVTDRPDLLLTVLAADCALVLLADAEAGVIGACHSGWRGTVARIVPATVEAMARLSAQPDRIAAWIAPCISSEAFEVGEEVAAAFPARAVERREEWPRPHVDLRAEVRAQLTEAGVHRVETSTACTVRDGRNWYSYRAEGGTPGRLVGFIGRRSAG